MANEIRNTNSPSQSSVLDRLRILASSAKYDVSCASSGSTRKKAAGSLGSVAPSGICHSWAADGRCISLLKILLTNHCMYDCRYCLNRRSNDIERTMLTPEELADLTIAFYRRNYIEGLFLSSGIFRSPDYTMELLLRTVKLLRETHAFGGYIHLKAIPGADSRLIYEAGKLVDRLSVNIELPSQPSLKLLAPDKSRETILTPMARIRDWRLDAAPPKGREMPRRHSFVPAGQSTQMIIGATPEDDQKILSLADGLYKNMGLKRVYYSAYVPVNNDRNLPTLPMPPLLREHRLYQADWLLRFYHFNVSELFENGPGELDHEFDPKIMWALRHLHLFPFEVNSADYEMLLRVPGLGVISAQKILRARRAGRLTLEDLPKLGVVWKRARYFLCASGAYAGGVSLEPDLLRKRLLSIEPPALRPKQLSFADIPAARDEFRPREFAAAVTGQF